MELLSEKMLVELIKEIGLSLWDLLRGKLNRVVNVSQLEMKQVGLIKDAIV